VANNNFPQITSITSESLQAQIRNLLPSQEGFGTDLMAQNVIVPVVDLTQAAEGSQVSENLQTAIAFGSQTTFDVKNGNSAIITNTGFWRIFGTGSVDRSSATNRSIIFQASDSFSAKDVWQLQVEASNATNVVTIGFDFVFFAASGITLNAIADSSCAIAGSVRQIADVNGALVNPSGFNPQ